MKNDTPGRRRAPAPQVTHPRVAHVKRDPFDIYVGRGECPCKRPIGVPRCAHHQGDDWGNPFALAMWGPLECMTKFFDMLAESGPGLHGYIRDRLRGKVLGCWCKGRYPVCHAEALARLADGEALDAIRADMLSRLAPKAPEPDLFDGGAQ